MEEVLQEKVRRERDLPSCSNAGAAGGRKNSETQQGNSKRKQRESPGEENRKKKADKEREESAFNKSNLTARSPEKEEMKGEEKGKLERMEVMLGRMMLGIEENKKTLNERFNKVEEKMEAWENRWEGLEAKVGEVKEHTKKEIEKVREEMEEKWKVWGEEAEEWMGRYGRKCWKRRNGTEREADRGE